MSDLKQYKEFWVMFKSLPTVGKIGALLFILVGVGVVGYIKDPQKMTEIYETVVGKRPKPSELSRCEALFWDDIRNEKLDNGATPISLDPKKEVIQLANDEGDKLSLRCRMSIIYEDGTNETVIATRALKGLALQVSISSVY